MAREIVMRFDAAGNISVDAVGYQGQGCKEATKVFENAFIATGKKSHDKPEAFMPENTGVHVTAKRW